MKFVDEFRDADSVRRLSAELGKCTTRPWTLMEVCGGQTHALLRFGIDQLLPAGLTLLHGPGCPVCVTPVELIDTAIELALRPDVTLCSFGDMLRVPGRSSDLFGARARGADVRVVYSPLDALALAKRLPHRKVAFFAVGFETTAPANALSVELARREGVANYSLLVAHVLVPPAMEAILASPDNRVQGFLAAGHVSAVLGSAIYSKLCERYHVPVVVTGFEPVDLLQGILQCVRQLEGGRHSVENAYGRAVTQQGNQHAQALVERVFRVVDREWRGMGPIGASGLALNPEYGAHDAERVFELQSPKRPELEPSVCIAGKVLTGAERPNRCPAFATECTPSAPLGAPMVSSEGACAAYYRYRHQP